MEAVKNEVQNEKRPWFRGNINLLTIGLPVVVIVPLLVASWFIGPGSIWFWAGIGVGMAIYNYWYRE